MNLAPDMPIIGFMIRRTLAPPLIAFAWRRPHAIKHATLLGEPSLLRPRGASPYGRDTPLPQSLDTREPI
jgi:hypothetical protein